MSKQKVQVTSWLQFAAQIRTQQKNLLSRLDEFPNSILVAGCQRSGTTMLSRILTQSTGMTNYWSGGDDELDAALILSGAIPHIPQGRYCFQTTYLNDNYQEYFTLTGKHRIIWLVRNPYSVVYSMLYNWKDYALNELATACGTAWLTGLDKMRYTLGGVLAIDRLKRACLAYCGKSTQIFELSERLDKDSLLVIDYDELVTHKEVLLPYIYEFADLPYEPTYTAQIHVQSLDKSNLLSRQETNAIQRICLPVYNRIMQLGQVSEYRTLFASATKGREPCNLPK